MEKGKSDSTEKISELEASKQDLQKQLENAEARFSELEDQVNLQTEITQSKEDGLQSLVRQKHTENKAMKTTIQNLNEKITGLELELQDTRSALGDLQSKHEALEEELKQAANREKELNSSFEQFTKTSPNQGRQKKKRGRPNKNKVPDFDESDKDLESSAPKRERSSSTLHKPETLRIYIRMLTGEHLVLDVHHAETVAIIKTRVAEATGLPVGQQRIVYAGRQLVDFKTMSDYGIQTEDKMDMVLKLSGS